MLAGVRPGVGHPRPFLGPAGRDILRCDAGAPGHGAEAAARWPSASRHVIPGVSGLWRGVS